MTMAKRLAEVLEEMRMVFARMDSDAVSRLAGEIVSARRILVYGVGRNGLVLQAFAMRLMHLDLDGHFVGQLATPPVAKGDLLLVASAIGRLPTADAIITSAKAAGARIAVISGRPKQVSNADVIIALPAQTMADPVTSILPLGSQFELACRCSVTLPSWSSWCGSAAAMPTWLRATRICFDTH
jgi:6-phospho-3-hexuloisomerase